MKISYLSIKNFKSIKSLVIEEIDQAMILVGKNSTGKTSILDALRAVSGDYVITRTSFLVPERNIEIEIVLDLDDRDLAYFRKRGMVSQYKRETEWKKDFLNKLPSFQNEQLHFTFVANQSGRIRYEDGFRKNNPYIPKVLPKIHFIGDTREIDTLENDIFLSQG